MKRILLDQGLPAPAAQILRTSGWDAIHLRELSMQQASDPEILAMALQQSRTIITLDRDFPQMLALTAAERPSVVLIRQQRLRTAEVASLLDAIWQAHEPDIERGCVLKVGTRGIRIRHLPLR